MKNIVLHRLQANQEGDYILTLLVNGGETCISNTRT